MRKMMVASCLAFVCFTGCMRPFEPVKLEEISNNEAAFLIPYTGNIEDQTAVNKKEYLEKKIVLAKQIRIPQQWRPVGHERFFPNGEWIDAAKLIKVDQSAVNRVWTAEKNSGTSDRDEAIWAMTSDQVEWSTGWVCSAEVDDPVVFLSLYPNGSLEKVMDFEIRGKLQTVFGLNVTDLPMEMLKKNATPVINKTVDEVKKFFEVKGIKITNLGISGGFVYKNPTIAEKMAEVYKAEQEHSIALAKTRAQEEDNKRIRLKAQAEADAVTLLRKAEADAKKLEAEGIKSVADAKAYEIEKAKDNLPAYVQLKRIELEKEKMTKWDGKFPTYFMGDGKSLDLLLSVPAPPLDKK